MGKMLSDYDVRLSNLERERVIGTLKIEGKGVPPRSRGEHLLHLVQQIARKDLGLKIWASDVAKVERQTPNRKSPILVK